VLKWIQLHQKKFDELGLSPSVFNNQIDFDGLEHKEVIRVIRSFPGRKWSKTPTDNGLVNYESVADGMKLRCWHGHPPPSCKIVEELVTVPARQEIVRRLVCPKGFAV
jgi:hypothetical protein